MSRFDRMLATILCKRNVMNEDQRESLVSECERLGQPLPGLLLSRQLCREPELIAAVAEELSCHPILLEHVTPSPDALELFSAQQCLDNEVLPISRLNNTITLAVANPFDEPRLDQIRSETGCEVIPVLTTAPSLRRKLKSCFPELPIEADETATQGDDQSAASDQGEDQSSWTDLAQELEKVAEQPGAAITAAVQEPPVDITQEEHESPPVDTTEIDVTSITSDQEQESIVVAEAAPDTEHQPPTEEESQPDLSSGEVEVDVQLDADVQSETPPQTDVSLDRPETDSTQETTDAAAGQEEMPIASDTRGEEQSEASSQEEEHEPPADQGEVPVDGDVQLETEPPQNEAAPSEQDQIQVEEEIHIEVQAETEPEQDEATPPDEVPGEDTQDESAKPSDTPDGEEEEKAVSTTITARSWDEVVKLAAKRSKRVSWWRAGEAGVPAADEELKGDDALVVDVARAFLLDAFKQGFEELVFDAAEDGLHVQERTARVSQSLTTVPHHLQQTFLARLKWMAGLPLDRRGAQAGSLMASSRGREFVCRLYVVPTIHGERVQIELLPAETFSVNLDGLGITGAGADDFKWGVANPAGLLLLAAPPGHGREPTLRALLGLSRPNNEQAVSIEDPVMVRLPGVAQVPVGRASKLRVTQALRTVLRRAPDRLMITNINNPQAARMAVQAAASGSLVLAGLDAPDVFCALDRLAACGAPAFTLGSALRLATSQRRLRKLCEACREPVPVNRDALLAAGCREDQLAHANLFRAVGCDACHRGYSGHLPVFETLRIAGDLRRLVASGAPVSDWRAKTAEWGFLTLRRNALQFALNGQTSLEEVLVGTPEDI